MEFTHSDDQGNALMVGVGDKAETKQEAVAKGSVFMNPQCLEKVAQGAMAEGDVPGAVRMVDTVGVKRTSKLIPLCYILNFVKLTVDFTIRKESNEIETVCTARTTGKIGVEMEVLTGVPVALLTVYDMCKAVDRSMEIGDIHLEHRSEGKSGEFHNPRCARNRGWAT